PGCSRACRGRAAEGTGPASKNSRSLSFNPLANKRVQPFARGQVHVDSQTFLEQTLAGDQVKRVEFAAGVVINEQVQVAFRSSIAFGCGTKQVKRGRAPRPQGASESAQFLKSLCSVHALLLSHGYGKQQKPIQVSRVRPADDRASMERYPF